MSVAKIAFDRLLRAVRGHGYVPTGLFELSQYFRQFGSIKFKFSKEGERLIAVSENYRYGSIVTSGSTPEELDKNIKDAILTSFSVPSSYAKDAKVRREGERSEEYALA